VKSLFKTLAGFYYSSVDYLCPCLFGDGNALRREPGLILK